MFGPKPFPGRVKFGKAAAVCVKHATTPRGVYEKHLTELQNLMKKPGPARAT